MKNREGIEDKKKWWDGECRRKKKEAERILREWRSGKVDKKEIFGRKKEI